MNAAQRRNVRLALRGVKEFGRFHGYDEKAQQRLAQMVLMGMCVEGNLYNYANRNVAKSLHYPHDKVGSDHDSVGVLQQRASGTWSPATSIELKMRPDMAARAFLTEGRRKGLLRAEGPTLGRRVQSIQVSAFPTRYHLQGPRAALIRRRYWKSA